MQRGFRVFPSITCLSIAGLWCYATLVLRAPYHVADRSQGIGSPLCVRLRLRVGGYSTLVQMNTVALRLPVSGLLPGSVLMYMAKEVGVMFQWFADVGYGADIKALRKEEPKLQDFGTWLKESSEFRKQ